MYQILYQDYNKYFIKKKYLKNKIYLILMSVKQIFLQQIDNFINELCTIFPNNNDILLFREKYLLIKGMNSKVVIEYFIQYIYPFKTKVM